MHEKLIFKMMDFFFGDPKRIQHFMKVHYFARMIGLQEGLEKNTLCLLEATAILHDCGIRPAELKYGSCHGKLQEQEGPAAARAILRELGYDKTYGNDFIDRICYIIGHHHTYDNIDGIDYQILVEADFLVNLYEDAVPRANLIANYEKIFKTEAGKKICRMVYDIDYTDKDSI